MMETSGKPEHVLIVGAGMIGLTAALRLVQAGVRVTVLERDNEPGGLCRGFDAGDMRADRYHHFITGADSNLISLIRELGLEDRLSPMPARTASLTDAGIVPLSGAMDLLRFPGAPLWEKLRFGFAVNALTRFSDWRSFESIPAAGWIQSKGGPRLYEKMWKNLFDGKFGAKVEQIPLSWFWARVRRRISRRRGPADLFAVLDGSLDVLIDALVEKIKGQGGRIQLKAPVARIRREKGDFAVTTDDGNSLRADRVMVTAPLPAFLQMTPDLDADYQRRCAAVEYSGIINAVFVMKNQVSDFFWINVNRPGIPFLGIIQTTRLLPSPNHHLIYLPRYRPADHPDFDRDAADLLDEFQTALFHAFPNLTNDIVLSRSLFRERLADPYYTLNYSGRIPPHQAGMSGLYCFNTAQIYPQTRSADSSVAFGEKAAGMILSDRHGHE